MLYSVFQSSIAPTVTAILRQADTTKLFRTLFFKHFIRVRQSKLSYQNLLMIYSNDKI
jgi:hypothetical protein